MPLPVGGSGFSETTVRNSESTKALSPMLATLLPIVTEVKPVQLRKAEGSMLITLFGIVTEVKPAQPEKA